MVAASTIVATATPELPTSALLGHLGALGRDPLAFLDDAHRQMGDVFRMRLGPRSIVVVVDPLLIEEVLVAKQRHYNKQTRGYDNLRKMVGNGLVTSEGDFWLRQRRIAQPAFHRERIQGFADTFRRATVDAVAAVPTAPDEPFDLAHLLTTLTMRLAGETLFSVDVSGASDEVGAAIAELVRQAASRTFSFVNLPDVFPSPQNRRLKRSTAVLDALVFRIIAERRSGAHKPDLLSILMEATDEETGERMSDRQLRDEMVTLFSAGHETTANALAWTFLLLAQHPEALTRLVTELDAVVGVSDITLQHVARLPFLDACIKESMRLYPPIWMIVRNAVDDDSLGGHAVHRGEFVFLPQWLVHRHPRLWPEPLAFRPERFLADDDTRPRYSYFPFLGGPRKCIGDVFAQLEAKVIVATLLQRLRLRLVGPPPAPEPLVTLRPLGGLWFSAERR